jgi:hypothetical protein
VSFAPFPLPFKTLLISWTGWNIFRAKTKCLLADDKRSVSERQNLDFSLQAGITIALSNAPHVVPVFPERDFIQSGLTKS